MDVSVRDEIAYMLGNLKVVLQDLKTELSKGKIDRDSIQNLLFKIREITETLRILSKKYSDEVQSTMFLNFLRLAQKSQNQSQKSTMAIGDLFNIFSVPKPPVEALENLSSYIGTLLMLFTHASDKLSDEYYREKLYEIIPKIKSVADSISVSIGTDLGVLPKLGSLNSLISRWGFSENWIVSIAYLQALEVIVNKLVKELNIEVEEGAGFKEKFRKIIERLQDKDVELTKLEEKLPQLFWDLRHKIVHAGYEPNDAELNTIVAWTFQILNKLTALRIKNT